MMGNFENENFEKKDRQLDNLINLVENHTRTERHLEQYSEIGNPENRENARKVQGVREGQIEKLKNQIKGVEENETTEEQLDTLREKYESTEGYIRHNAESMDPEQLNNLEKKQENRKNQINFLEDES